MNVVDHLKPGQRLFVAGSSTQNWRNCWNEISCARSPDGFLPSRGA